MKFRPIKTGLSQPYAYRQFYCGTCKTLGKNFGQASRVVLNHDAIFLGELLNDISKEETDVFSHSKAYESYNCFSLPQKAEIPTSLQYAAAANVLLGSLSANDHVIDTKGVKQIVWRTVRAALKPALLKAHPILSNSALPLGIIKEWINEQQEREQSPLLFDDPQEAARYFAEPTAHITGLVFQYGTYAIARPELADQFFEFGYQFGQLIYLLDAFKDVKKDQAQHAFNGLEMAEKVAGKQLTHRKQTLPFLQEELQITKELLKQLPLSADLKRVGIHRLLGNAKQLLGLNKAGRTKAVKECRPKMTFKEKWETAQLLSNRILERGNTIRQNWLGKVKYQASFYSLSLTMMALPEPKIRQLSEQPEIAETYTNMAYLPLVGAAIIGLVYAIPLVSSLMPSKSKKRNDDGDEEEEETCGDQCCDSCCESCGEACGDYCAEECCGIEPDDDDDSC